MKTSIKSLCSSNTKNTQKLRLYIFMAGLMGVILLFTPFFQITIITKQNSLKNLYFSCFKLLTSQPIKLIFLNETKSIAFSWSTKLLSASNLIFAFIGLVLAHFKKNNLAAANFFLASVCPLSAIFAIGNLRNQLLDLQLSSNKFFITLLWPFFLIVLAYLFCTASCLLLIGKEHLAKTLFFSLTWCSTAFIILITLFLLCNGWPAIAKIGIFNFLFSPNWNPATNNFGILNLIAATIFTTTGSIILGSVFGILTAIFMAELCPNKILIIIKPLVELLASVPSVVFGFFGMTIIVPTIKKIFHGFTTSDGSPVVGDSVLAAILVLTLMILPTIVNTSFVALKSVPNSFKEASLGLGANQTETIFKICVKAATPSILSGLVLAIGRALGETMAVIMVAGNIAKPPELLGTTRLLTTGIAMDLSYASGLLRNALFAIGLVLLTLIVIVNLSFNLVFKKRLHYPDSRI